MASLSSPSFSSSSSSSDEDLLFEAIQNDDAVLDKAVQAVLQDYGIFDDDETSDEDTGTWGGSKPGKAPNKNRDFWGAYKRLIEYYFSGTDSLYDEGDFERRFRCPRAVFEKLRTGVLGKGTFVQRQDTTKKLGINPLVRLTACMRKLAYGDASDREDGILTDF